MKWLKNNKLFCIYTIIWLICVGVFWTYPDNCGLGYGLIVFYVILPVTTFVASYFYGKRESRWKWFVCVYFGFMEVMVCWFTFDLANMIEFKRLNTPNWGMAVGIMMLSFVGLILGHVSKKRKAENNE